MLRKVEFEELNRVLSNRKRREQTDLSNCLFYDMDLSGRDLRNINFDKSDFRKMNLNGADMTGCSAENSFFQTSSLEGTVLKDCNLRTADFRFCNMKHADISGSDIFGAALHGAELTGLKADENTKFYYPRCPMEGAFIGWKVCFGRRIVQLMVPKDARRLQGTTYEIRVDKAFVISIRSEDYKTEYEEAHSYVDENFYYRKHQWVSVDQYDTERFTESGGGIHIWMDREAAIAYLG